MYAGMTNAGGAAVLWLHTLLSSILNTVIITADDNEGLSFYCGRNMVIPRTASNQTKVVSLLSVAGRSWNELPSTKSAKSCYQNEYCGFQEFLTSPQLMDY